jgi:hypothetical protein
MHVAYSTSGVPEAEPLPALGPVGAAVVVVARLATPEGEPPPQAAAAMTIPMKPGATSSNCLRNRNSTWGAADAGEKA